MEAITNLLIPDSLGDIMIYVIFFCCIIQLVVTPEKNDTPQYLLFAVMAMCAIDLLRNAAGASFPIDGFDNRGFGTFIMHIAMAIFPMVAGGMTRKQGRKGGMALPMGVLTGIIAGVYAIGAYAMTSSFYA
jgi:hypothetical protein